MQTKKRYNRSKKERQNCKERLLRKQILSKTASKHKINNNKKPIKIKYRKQK